MEHYGVGHRSGDLVVSPGTIDCVLARSCRVVNKEMAVCCGLMAIFCHCVSKSGSLCCVLALAGALVSRALCDTLLSGYILPDIFNL